MRTMRAAITTRSGGPEVLEVRDVPQPVPGPNEVLIRVHATAVNRADLLQREGKYPAPPGSPQDIPGMEYAGEIVSFGPHTTRWQAGQRVFGIVGGGSYAEYLVTHEDTCVEVPSHLSWTDAASIPEVFITAHDALWTQAGLRAGERVLIHAVGSGVGIAALQLVRVRGAVPFGTSRTKNKLNTVSGFGMQDGLHVSEDLAVELKDFSERVTGGRGFDVVLDLVGGDYLPASISVLAPKGRIMLVGTVAGHKTEVNLSHILGKRAHLIGTVLRARPLEEKISVAARFREEVVPLFADGTLRTLIDKELPFTTEGVRAAQERVGSNQSVGKVVLSIL